MVIVVRTPSDFPIVNGNTSLRHFFNSAFAREFLARTANLCSILMKS